jgi:hypothetical protein
MNVEGRLFGKSKGSSEIGIENREGNGDMNVIKKQHVYA